MELSGELLDAVAAFCEFANDCVVSPIGSGNINDTYLVKAAERSFVLQKINKDVFPRPEQVIENFQVITDHLHNKEQGSLPLRTSRPVITLQNTLGFQSSHGNWWRGQSYIKHRSYGQLQSPAQARDLGAALAAFHTMVKDLDGEKLSDPLPGFHDLRSYLTAFSNFSGSSARVNSDDLVWYCHKIVNDYNQEALCLHEAFDTRQLKRQIVHGDPKLENFMFDNHGRCVGLLDLDTVGLGLFYHDLGDCLRSCCNVAGEQGSRPSSFSLDVCSEFLKSYLSGVDKSLSPDQSKCVYHGIVHICFELGLRFFTDYLRGNTYFKVESERDNLSKAVSQFQLVEDVVSQKHEIYDILQSIQQGNYGKH